MTVTSRRLVLKTNLCDVTYNILLWIDCRDTSVELCRWCSSTHYSSNNWPGIDYIYWVMYNISSWMTMLLALNILRSSLTKKIITIVPLQIGDRTIKTKPVVMKSWSTWSFFDYMWQTAFKAVKDITALSRLMSNVGRPKFNLHLLTVNQSVLLHSTEVWMDALSKKMHHKQLL